MDKSFYYLVNHSEVEDYKKILDLMKIPYIIESPIHLMARRSNQDSIVLPNMPVRLYAMVRKLFRSDGKRYS